MCAHLQRERERIELFQMNIFTGNFLTTHSLSGKLFIFTNKIVKYYFQSTHSTHFTWIRSLWNKIWMLTSKNTLSIKYILMKRKMSLVYILRFLLFLILSGSSGPRTEDSLVGKSEQSLRSFVILSVSCSIPLKIWRKMKKRLFPPWRNGIFVPMHLLDCQGHCGKKIRQQSSRIYPKQSLPPGDFLYRWKEVLVSTSQPTEISLEKGMLLRKCQRFGHRRSRNALWGLRGLSHPLWASVLLSSQWGWLNQEWKFSDP